LLGEQTPIVDFYSGYPQKNTGPPCNSVGGVRRPSLGTKNLKNCPQVTAKRRLCGFAKQTAKPLNIGADIAEAG
jgi:hypothetical protein